MLQVFKWALCGCVALAVGLIGARLEPGWGHGWFVDRGDDDDDIDNGYGDADEADNDCGAADDDWSRAGDMADLLTMVMMIMVVVLVVVVLVIVRLLKCSWWLVICSTIVVKN